MKIDKDRIAGVALYGKPLLYAGGAIACLIGAIKSANILGFVNGMQHSIVTYEDDPENFEEDFVNKFHPKKAKEE